jgi:hypothetical protein
VLRVRDQIELSLAGKSLEVMKFCEKWDLWRVPSAIVGNEWLNYNWDLSGGAYERQ